MPTPSTPAASAAERAIDTKLTAARARLILDKPFLGALVLRLPLRPASPDWCPTTATDARAFYYNPAYIDALTLAETQFMLAHEALHCALSHFARRQHRTRHKWDLACDYAINPLLIDDGLTPPPNALVMPLYRGLTAEEIYPLLDDNDQSETLDTHAYDRAESSPDDGGSGARRERELRGRKAANAERDGSAGHPPQPRRESGPDGAEERALTAPLVEAPPPLSPDERERLAARWQQRLAGAAQQAERAGKLGGQLRRLLEQLLQPSLPWRALLARYLSARAREDYSYARPSRRECALILPSRCSHQLDLAVAVDISGSLKDAEIAAFVTEIDALKGQLRARLILLPCDAALAPGAPFVFQSWEEFRCPAGLHGGGGTDFTPVFDWLARADRAPDLLVYFTDAEGRFPAQPPPFPVVWLVKGRGVVPWGERIALN